ncbi:MAG: DUF59 domain-containing protein [Alphaproteobacteria bacterium]
MSQFDDGRSLSDFMPGAPAPGEEFVARAGASLASDEAHADAETVITALKTVHDPEIPVNIYDLGLIYDVALASDGSVVIEMTLTTPACPVAGILPQQVADAAAGVPGVGKVEVRLVWEPTWTPELMSEEARLVLDMF